MLRCSSEWIRVKKADGWHSSLLTKIEIKRRLTFLRDLPVLYDLLLAPLYPVFKNSQIQQLFPEWFLVQFAAFHLFPHVTPSTHCNYHLFQMEFGNRAKEKSVPLAPSSGLCLHAGNLPLLALAQHSIQCLLWFPQRPILAFPAVPFTQLRPLLYVSLSPLKDYEPQEGKDCLVFISSLSVIVPHPTAQLMFT